MPRIDINRLLRERPVSGRYGAPMGQANQFDPEAGPLYLQRVRFVDGDYATDGTYWGGGGEPLWCAFTAGLQTTVYVRAVSRSAALAAVVAEHPSARFHRVE